MIRVLLHIVLALSVVTFILLVLVTRFGLVEASLASFLSRALKGSSFDQSQRTTNKCRVERRIKGIRHSSTSIVAKPTALMDIRQGLKIGALLHIHREGSSHACESDALHGPTGVRIHNVRLAEAALQQGSCGAFQLLSFAIAYIDIQIPSWRRPLCIHVRGVHAELRQRQMPQVHDHHFCTTVELPYNKCFMSRTMLTFTMHLHHVHMHARCKRIMY